MSRCTWALNVRISVITNWERARIAVDVRLDGVRAREWHTVEGGTATGSVFALGVGERLTLRLSFGMEGTGAGAAAIAGEEENWTTVTMLCQASRGRVHKRRRADLAN